MSVHTIDSFCGARKGDIFLAGEAYPTEILNQTKQQNIPIDVSGIDKPIRKLIHFHSLLLRTRL